MVNLSDPVVWITIATVSTHRLVTPSPPLLYFGLIFPFEIPKAVCWHVRVLWRVDYGWRHVRGMPEGKSWRSSPSLDQRLEKQHILFQSQTCQRSGATVKLCLTPGHSCHCDPGDTGMTSSMAAASHTPHSLTPQLFLCDHFLNKSSCVSCVPAPRAQRDFSLACHKRGNCTLYLMIETGWKTWNLKDIVPAFTRG